MFGKKSFRKAMPMLASVLVAAVLLIGAGSALAVGNSGGTGNQGAGIGRTVGNMADQVCSLLGISRQELSTERQAGKSLAEIAAAHNVTKTQLTANILEKRQAALKQALEDKKITQTQYDNCIKNMRQNIEKNITRTTVGPNGNGRGQGRRGQMGNGCGGGCGQQCRFTASN